jgi:predicted dehydrogenase
MRQNPGNLSRREVLRRSTALGAALAMPAFVPAGALGQGGQAPASERINLGVIGCGPRCRYDLGAILKMEDVRCVAISDAQEDRRNAGKKLVDESYGNTDCAAIHDFREVLDRKDIDAVLIATGDRWHAHAAILAARAGKDIYCEKPCGITIELCQAIDETMRQTKRVFQAGTQRRSVPNFQRAVAMARDGKLGELKTLYASVYTPEIKTQWLPGEPTPSPEKVDWDLWLGPAPWRPYNHVYVQGGWRAYYDFESGARLLDWGAHTVDLCQWANDADGTMPISYEPSEKGITARYANGVTLILDFLATPFGDRPGWINELGNCPVRFVGSKGSVETGDNGGIVVLPESLQNELGEKGDVSPDVGLDVSAHARNFFDCVKSRAQPVANASNMRSSHIACHAAALSWTLGRTLKLDPASQTFIDDDEANGLRSRPARKPWDVV